MKDYILMKMFHYWLKKNISLIFYKNYLEKRLKQDSDHRFPITEPSAEVDIYWGLNNESDYKLLRAQVG